MPLEQKFLDLSAHLGTIRGSFVYCAAISQRFPAKADQLAFFDWSREKADERRQRLYTPLSREAFIRQVEAINFRDPDSCAALLGLLLRPVQPCIPLGHDTQGNRYRLAPHPFGLVAHHDAVAAADNALPSCFLGVNTNVQPFDIAAVFRSSSASAASNSSDDGTNGFYAHQLGALELRLAPSRLDHHRHGNNNTGDDGNEDDSSQGNSSDDDDDDDDGWRHTGFFVVTRIALGGGAAGLYVLLDAFPVDGCTGDRIARPATTTAMGSWPSGSDDNDGEPFVSARVGGVDGLGACRVDFSTPLQWVDRVAHAVELVRVVRDGWSGELRRAAVRR